MWRLVMVLLVLTGPAWAGEQVTRDVSYGLAAKQKLDVYWDDARRGAPVIVMLHGGAWRTGDKGNRAVWQQKVAYWRPKGFVFVSVNTRLLPGTAPQGQVEDMAKAVAHVQKNARRWGGDPARVVLMGHSAGAHVAAMVGADRDLQRRFGLGPLRGTVVLDTTAVDLVATMSGRPPRPLKRVFGDSPETWRALSPKAQLDRGAAPFLVVCSSQRRGVCSAAKAFAQTSRQKQVATTLVPVAKDHRSINADLGKPSAYTRAVSDWITARVR